MEIINGLILSGGQSTRMGMDKSLLDFHGKPQRDYLRDLLKPFCTQVYLSTKKKQSATFCDTEIPDHYDLDSPLNGILSAFQFDPDSAWLTVPVDMPNISKETLEYLLKHRNPKKIATCFYDTDGERPEPLLTLWEHAAKPFLFDYFNSGGVSPRKFLQQNEIHLIKAPHTSWLTNINTPENLEAYKKRKA